MAGVVVTGGALKCPHQGQAEMTSEAKLTVGGVQVVVAADLSTFTTYTGCTFTVNGAKAPCIATIASSGGSAHKLTVGARAVLLDDLKATTQNPQSVVSLSAGQAKLTAK
ncbi:hypothetical protein [Mycobacterium sp.]|uniref:hypothetical protein n=1 Tax=Mycobacterium sp. TaxID=1785 RepID=UPI003D0AEF22